MPTGAEGRATVVAVKLWFVLGSPAAQRFVEPVLFELRAAGHDVHVSIEAGIGRPFESAPDVPITGLAVPASASGGALRGVRLMRAFASYVALRGRWRPLMRRRWLEYFPPTLARAIRAIDALRLGWVLDNPVARRAAMVGLRAARPRAALRRQLNDVSPDLVVVTPMIYPGTRELDVVTAARAAGIPSFGMVLSWDNLTSKATFHERPDALLVWNEAQRGEATSWHGWDAARVEALGAPVFDYLFDSREVPTRDEIAQALGLDRNRDYVLYAVSSRLGLGAGGEIDVVRRLGTALLDLEWREEPPILVVRPHPRNAANFDEPLGANVVVMPAPGFPDTPAARRELHGLLRHAEAVIGLNTSLFIESAIVGTPVIAMSLVGDVEHERMPSSLTHFDHLLSAGFLHRVRGPEEVAAELVNLRQRNDREAATAAFVEAFVRPQGLGRSAARLVAERLTCSDDYRR